VIIRRTFSIIGILGALVAAQGLFHLGASVVAFGQGDPQFFMTMLIVPLIGAGILLLDLLNKSFKKIKWVMVALLLMCMVLMLNAPSLPVSMQVISGLAITTIAMLFIRFKPRKQSPRAFP
jgi:uncharacterized membrane protein YeaQ/YmgE (transglycosylase-associated protein family)